MYIRFHPGQWLVLSLTVRSVIITVSLVEFLTLDTYETGKHLS